MENKLAEGIFLSEKGKYKQAIKVFESVLKKEKSNQQALFECGYAYLSLEDDKSGIEKLKQLLSINPDYPGARDWYSKTIAKYGRKIEAAEIKYDDLKNKLSGELGMGVSPYGWTDCAEYYYLGGQCSRAKDILNEYFKIEGNVTAYERDKSAPYRLYAKILRQEKKFEEALEWIIKAKNLKYNVPADHELYVWLLVDLNRKTEAVLEFDKMIKDVFNGMDRFIQIQSLKKVIDEFRLTSAST